MVSKGDNGRLTGAGGKMKRASVPTVVNKLGHNGFCGYESVPEGVLVNVLGAERPRAGSSFPLAEGLNEAYRRPKAGKH